MKRTEITIETHRLLVLRTAGRSAWCRECMSQVVMITPNEAASIAQVTLRTVYKWIEDARLHFTEDPMGLVLICASSLSVAKRGHQTRHSGSA